MWIPTLFYRKDEILVNFRRNARFKYQLNLLRYYLSEEKITNLLKSTYFKDKAISLVYMELNLFCASHSEESGLNKIRLFENSASQPFSSSYLISSLIFIPYCQETKSPITQLKTVCILILANHRLRTADLHKTIRNQTKLTVLKQLL